MVHLILANHMPDLLLDFLQWVLKAKDAAPDPVQPYLGPRIRVAELPEACTFIAGGSIA